MAEQTREEGAPIRTFLEHKIGKEYGPPKGFCAFLPLSRPAVDSLNLLPTISSEQIGRKAIIAIPENPQIRAWLELSEKPPSQLTKEQIKAVNAGQAELRRVLKENDWKEVTAFSPLRTRNFGSLQVPFYGSIWAIPQNGGLWELPPGVYRAELPKQISENNEKLPEGAREINGFQERFEVMFLSAKKYGNHPGKRWVRAIPEGNKNYVVFPERKPNSADPKGKWVEDPKAPQGKKWQGKWIVGEWVVRKTPEAVVKYLKQRFGAELDIKRGFIWAPEEAHKQIIGKGGNHLNTLQQILNPVLKGTRLIVAKPLPETTK